MSKPDPVKRARVRVLVADDELGIRESLRLILSRGYDVTTAAGGNEALALAATHHPDLILLDVMMPDLDGLEVLEQLRKRHPEIAVVMLSAVTSIKTVVEAIRMGATDYISKPFEVDALLVVVERALERSYLKAEVERLRAALDQRARFDRMIGLSPPMRAIYQTIEQIATRKATVLITGDSGTGKELVARAIHDTGSRRTRPLIVVNCAAIPDALLESQLFGHEKGAFTDARDRHIGQFEAADTGTIFLDEIGELPLAMQAKLLRVLQDGELTRVGSTEPIKLDVRIIAATNRDLEQAVRDGQFREDLYYRINVVPIVLPPLSERREDIPFLVEHFLEKYVEEGRRLEMSPDAMDLLVAAPWPGNVRQLENIVERLVALAPEKTISPEHLPPPLHKRAVPTANDLRDDILAGRISLTDAVTAFEKARIEEALKLAGGVQSEACRLLGITRRVLKYKMDRCGIATA